MKNYYTRLLVPTLVAPDGLRHIIAGRDHAPYCGAPAEGEQVAPAEYNRSKLCQRCAQKYIKRVFGDAL